MTDFIARQGVTVAVREAIQELIGLSLSDDEVETLLSGQALSFEALAHNRSLSEMGTALIRADEVNRSTRPEAAEKHVCEEGCYPVNVLGIKGCVCPFSGPMELSFHRIEGKSWEF